MKRFLSIVFSILTVISCQKDDLSWKDEIASLKEDIKSLKSLLIQLQERVSIVNVLNIEDGYIIEFSDGKTITINNGKDSPSIIKITENEECFTFYFSDGTQVSCPKEQSNLHFIYRDTPNNRMEVFVPNFTEESQVLWMFEQNLLNNLMTIMSCKEIPNGSLNYLDGKAIISQGGTDWISPYIVHAINNADGDFPSADINYFTGGFHGYKQLSAGVSATAKTIEINAFVDGEQVYPGESCDGKNIKIEWKNLVQASNTEKEDGTGRFVLEEIVTCSINYHKNVDVSIKTIALEDIDIKRHYGLQCNNGGFKGRVLYPGSPDVSHEYESISHAPQGCKEIQFINDTYGFSMKSDDSFKYNTMTNYNVFYTSVHKGYFSAIMSDNDPIRLEQGKSITFKGAYSVFKP